MALALALALAWHPIIIWLRILRFSLWIVGLGFSVTAGGIPLRRPLMRSLPALLLQPAPGTWHLAPGLDLPAGRGRGGVDGPSLS